MIDTNRIEQLYYRMNDRGIILPGRNRDLEGSSLIETTSTNNQEQQQQQQFDPQSSTSQSLTIATTASNTENSSSTSKDVLYKVSNRFIDRDYEKAFQAYCCEHSFKRAQLLMLLVLMTHLALSVTFAVLEDYDADGLDLLPRNISRFGEWAQWIYGLIALPLSLWPTALNPMRSTWKSWVSACIILMVVGIQVWLTYQTHLSTENFNFAMSLSLDGEILSGDVNATEDDLIYRSNMSVEEFLIERNTILSSAFVALTSTLLTLVGTTFAVAMRLDFPHVLIVCICVAVSLTGVLGAYRIKHLETLVAIYVFSGSLLVLSCYYSDRASRLAFAAKQKVEIENTVLEAALQEAEDALKNGAARESETEAVREGLLMLQYDDKKSKGSTSRNKCASLLDSVQIAFDEIKLIKRIGRGGMGEVILAKYLGTEVVCKRLLRDQISVSTMRSFRAEIDLLSTLRHPNIVQLIGASWDNCSNVCMVMEYVPNGDVHSVLRSSSGVNFTWSDPLLKIAMDAAQGMLYLHSQDPPVVHRDLKTVNLLCSNTYGCKVSDFGLSRRTASAVDPLTTVVGTPFWLAPEIIRHSPYVGTKADVYSFGIVLTELETRQNPYHDQKDQRSHLKIMMRIAKEGLRPTLPPTCLPMRRRLIEDCLQNDPAARPTFADILERLASSVQQELVGTTTTPSSSSTPPRSVIPSVKSTPPRIKTKFTRQKFVRKIFSNLFESIKEESSIDENDDDDSNSV